MNFDPNRSVERTDENTLLEQDPCNLSGSGMLGFESEDSGKRQAAILRQAKRNIGISLLAAAFITVCSSVASNLIAIAVYWLFPNAQILEEMWFSMLISSVSMYGIAMPLSLLLYRMVPATKIPRRNMEPAVFVGVVGICFLCTFVGNYLGNQINYLIGALIGKLPENQLAQTTSQMAFGWNLIFTVLLAPIFEEIFFRKLLLDRIVQYGELPAVLISGIVFGLIHGNLYQFFYAAMVGILFGYVYLKTGKLRYSVSMHMILNFIGGVFTSEMLKQLEPYYTLQGTVVGVFQSLNGWLMLCSYYAFLAISIVGGIVALVLLWKKVTFQRAEIPLTQKNWVSVLLQNPACWLFLCIAVFWFLIALL